MSSTEPEQEKWTIRELRDEDELRELTRNACQDHPEAGLADDADVPEGDAP